MVEQWKCLRYLQWMPWYKQNLYHSPYMLLDWISTALQCTDMHEAAISSPIFLFSIRPTHLKQPTSRIPTLPQKLMVFVKTLGFVGQDSGKHDAHICIEQCSSIQLCQGGWGCYGIITNEATLNLKGSLCNQMPEQKNTELCTLGSDVVVVKAKDCVACWGWDPVSKQWVWATVFLFQCSALGELEPDWTACLLYIVC